MQKKLGFIVTLVLAMTMLMNSALACTTYGIGREATADGSTMTTHTCDSTGDDFRMWIIPAMEGGEGIERDIVIDGNTWGDWSNFPAVKNYGAGTVMGTMPQPENTLQYLHTNYSIMNEYGVSMGESTCSIERGASELAQRAYDLMIKGSTGIIDCYQAQHVALERAKTAREAVRIMGDLVEEYGWYGYAENINVCDGEEVWIAEYYGRDIWCAVKIPDNAFFVCANRARIDHIDFEDEENYMWSPNLKSFAIENGLWSEESGEEFNPSKIYAPNTRAYSFRREWRALDLVAPSLHLDPNAGTYPLYVIPEKKLSVQDVFMLNSDYYQGTEYDASLTPAAGPYGNPLDEATQPERTINMYRCTYSTIANVKSWLPNETKCLIWHGLGASDTTYLVPLWASMTRLPECYATGSRYGKFDRDSAWWTCSYVQQTATQNYCNAVEEIHAARDPRMAAQYEQVVAIQEAATKLIEDGKREQAIELITSYAYNNAEDWHEYWLELGDELYGTYMFNRKDMASVPIPEWWKEILKNAPNKPVEAQ